MKLTKSTKNQLDAIITPEPIASIRDFTPALVQRLMEINTHNRDPRPKRISVLERAIKEGRWHLTNQGFGVSSAGFLADGGNRLEAIRRTGITVRAVLVTGIHPEAQKYIDNVSNRSPKDALKMFFEREFQQRIVEALTMLWRVRDEDTRLRLKPLSDDLIEIADLFDREHTQVGQVKGIRRLTGPVLAAIIERMKETGDPRVLTFLNQLIDGEMIQRGDPAYALRTYLSQPENLGGGGRPAYHMSSYRKAHYALDAFLEDRKIPVVREKRN